MGFLQELITKLGFSVDTEGLEHLTHTLEKVAERTKLLLGIEIIKGLYELSERFAGLGEQLESSAIAAGLTTEELQKLQFAASQNAVSNEQLNGILMRLGRTMQQAQKGSKGAVEAFGKLGITPDQIAGFETARDALYAVQDGMAGLTTQQDRLAVSQQLLGRQGARALKFLRTTSDATKQLGERAGKMGAIISDEGVAALAEFEDAASGLGQVMKGFLGQVASSFAPSFIGAIESIENAWANNRAFITDVLDDLAKKFAFAMGYISVTVENVGEVINAVIYRQGGIGDYVSNVVGKISNIVEKTANFIGSLVKGAVEDGSLQQLGASLFDLATELYGIVSDLVIGLGEALDAFGRFLGLDTGGLGKANTLLRVMLVTVNALVVALKALAVAARFLTGGQIGDYLGQTILGELAYYQMNQENAIQGLKDIAERQRAKRASMSFTGMPAATAALQGTAVPSAQPTFAGMQDPSGARSQVTINSQTTVNVPPGMTGEQAGELFAQKHKESLIDMLNQADRDSTPAWKY